MQVHKKVVTQRYTETHRDTQNGFISLRVALCVLVYLCGTIAVSQPLETALKRQKLVNVQTLDPSILVELKYSTTDNFVGKDVYDDLTTAYMQPLAARKLAEASRLLRARNHTLRLLVYDAARPRTAQWKLWNALTKYPEAERQKYVADPRKGSIHNYGCAVDLTLADKTGKAVDMGTPFDYFGILAYPSEETALLSQGKLTQNQVQNRQLLRSVMRRAGFSPIGFEWWHFNALPREKAKMMFRIVE